MAAAETLATWAAGAPALVGSLAGLPGAAVGAALVRLLVAPTGGRLAVVAAGIAAAVVVAVAGVVVGSAAAVAARTPSAAARTGVAGLPGVGQWQSAEACECLCACATN